MIALTSNLNAINANIGVISKTPPIGGMILNIASHGSTICARYNLALYTNLLSKNSLGKNDMMR